MAKIKKKKGAVEVTIDPRKAYRHLRHIASEKTRKRILRAGVRSGGSEVAKQVRKFVPVETGALKKAIRVRVRRLEQIYIASVHAANTGDGARNPARYLHLIERGARPHQILSTIAFKGKVYSQVYHPGFVGRRVLEYATKYAKKRAIQAFGRKVMQEVRKTR